MKERPSIALNVAAFLLPLAMGVLALASDAFLLLALFPRAAGTALFHPSNKLKIAARFCLLGYLVGFVALYLLLINSDMS